MKYLETLLGLVMLWGTGNVLAKEVKQPDSYAYTRGMECLDNVRASVVRNQKAPLLLGQSVLGRLGKIEIDNPGQKLVISQKVNKK